MALSASTSSFKLNDAAIAPIHPGLTSKFFHPSGSESSSPQASLQPLSLHLNQMPPQVEREDGGHSIEVKCEEEIFAKPATRRKRWYIDLTDEPEGAEDGERLEKKKKTQAGLEHESEVIDLT
jgi:hypothetical protein